MNSAILFGFALLLGLLIGGAVVWSRLQRLHADALRTAQAQTSAAQTQAAEAHQQTVKAQARITELTIRLEAEQQRSADQVRANQAAEAAFADKFTLLADQILEEKSKRFAEQNAGNLRVLLDPLKTQLTEFRAKIEETHAQHQVTGNVLSEHIKQLHAANRGLNEQAETLSRALRGDSRQSQGVWGELVLERVLEASGLRKGTEYETQVSDHAETDEGRQRFRPDVIVRLPANKDLVIDAKTSLSAYTRYVAAQSDVEREAAARDHVAAVRARIAELASKPYQHLQEIRTLDFVFLFMPVEPAYMLAAQRDPALFEDAFRQRILVTGPTTLMAMLRTVESIWRMERQSANAEQIAAQAGAMYDKLMGLLTDLQNVGKALDRAQAEHRSALNKLATGRGNLLGRAERVRELGAKTSKALPSGYPAAHELELGDDDG